ncbi:MAG: TolC family protein [Synechocystis sp.]
MQVATQNYHTAKEAVDLASKNLAANRTRFVAGVGTQLDVITAQNNLNQSKLSLLRAVVSHNQAIANLAKNTAISPTQNPQ